MAVLGSTGSIGRAALRVIERHSDAFEVAALAAGSSTEELREQTEAFGVRRVALAHPGLGPVPSGWGAGPEAVRVLCELDEVDVVVNAVVGAAGLEVTLAALAAGKRLALANKESLVAGGLLAREAARAGGGEIVPVDSEHSAILQCIQGARPKEVGRIILTASGGPFRNKTRKEAAGASVRDALRHPNWEMGAKISVDSATLANKALEVIEAHYLYDLPYDAIDVVVHPQSIVHSFVEFVDGSVLAQMGDPTMELPILYALSWPDRRRDPALRSYDPTRLSPLTFEPLDEARFPIFALGVEAGRRGGSAPCVFNAANEVAVEAFLEERIRFGDIDWVVRETMEKVDPPFALSLPATLAADAEARRVAKSAVALLTNDPSLAASQARIS